MQPTTVAASTSGNRTDGRQSLAIVAARLYVIGDLRTARASRLRWYDHHSTFGHGITITTVVVATSIGGLENILLQPETRLSIGLPGTGRLCTRVYIWYVYKCMCVRVCVRERRVQQPLTTTTAHSPLHYTTTTTVAVPLRFTLPPPSVLLSPPPTPPLVQLRRPGQRGRWFRRRRNTNIPDGGDGTRCSVLHLSYAPAGRPWNGL